MKILVFREDSSANAFGAQQELRASGSAELPLRRLVAARLLWESMRAGCTTASLEFCHWPCNGNSRVNSPFDLPVESCQHLGCMHESAYAVGQAVFIRTDTPDYAEETIPFKTLEELVKICSTPYPRLTLEKVVIYSMLDGEPCALTLGFISSTKAQRPSHLRMAE